MKRITNWRKATVADMEGDGLLDTISLFHVISLKMWGKDIVSIRGSDKGRLKAFLRWHIDNRIPVVGHFFILFDIPAFEKVLGIDLSELMVIDTVALSWYLNTDRKVHGLDSFLGDYGIAKPVIGEDEWKLPLQGELSNENFSIVLEEHYQLMKHRCTEDVKINVALWEDLQERLVDMYTKSKELVDLGEVGGKRISNKEEIYLDRFRNTISVDEWVDEILTFLMYKMDNIRIKEKTMWEADVPKVKELNKNLTERIEEAKETLESVMPPVPKYVLKKFPKKPIKKGKKGEPKWVLSAHGLSWNSAISGVEVNNDLGDSVTKKDKGEPYIIDPFKWKEGEGEGIQVRVLSKYEDPNAGSVDQIKKLLFKHGWKPKTFDFVDDKEAMDKWFAGGCRGRKPKPRMVPQISKKGEDGSKELCDSVLELAEEVPEIMAYQKYTTIKHRRDMVKGWLENLVDGKYLVAGCQGFTNTLREQHRGLVNLPGVDKPYGVDIRGSLIAGEGKISLGSDLSSLEDRTKHHFMLPHDPEYVATMMEPDYDPHILMALTAGMITEDEFKDFKEGIIPTHVKKARKAGKETNYASVYQAGPPTIARSAGVDEDTGKMLHSAYWELNWAVKEIAEEQVVITCSKGKKWLVNSLNGFCYSLRAEKDKFSTLCQGTGSYLFDMWIDRILTGMYQEFKVKRLNGLFHDEYITTFGDSPKNKEIMEDITVKAIEDVNTTYLLRREMGCDVQFGTDYSQIH